ncbi:MAG: hypothetical protein K2I97_02045, partial [Alistipes sp.]|nr:hypothetical protein [Alistipes sp.]
MIFGREVPVVGSRSGRNRLPTKRATACNDLQAVAFFVWYHRESNQGHKDFQDYYKQVAANKMQLRELTRQQKQVQKELDKNMKLEKSGKGSLTQMRAAVKSLTSEYENLSSTLRESDFGKRMASDIKSQQEAINEAEMSLGNYRSQVGNYENAIKDALGVNNKLIDSFKMLRTPIGALIGIVGSVMAIFKLFKSSLHDTQQTGDAYDNAMAGWSNTWDLFKKAVATVDFSLFIRNAAEAAAAGRNLQSVIDELFERTNSINIMRASMSKENAELEETLRNTGLSYSERLAAGEKYLENMQEIYKQEEEAARDVRDAQLENLFALTKTREYVSKEERERAKEEFADGIKNYNLTREKINAANELLRAEKAVNAIGSGLMNVETIKLLNDNLAEATENFRKLAGEQATQILEFQRQYSLTTDEQVKQYVDAEIKYQNAQAATYNDQKRIVNSINSIRAQATNEYIQNKEKEQKAAADAAKKEAELVKNSAERNAKIIMDAEAKILGITQQMREETRDNELLTLKENYEKETEILQNQIRND